MSRAVTAAHGPCRGRDYKLSFFQCCSHDMLLKGTTYNTHVCVLLQGKGIVQRRDGYLFVSLHLVSRRCLLAISNDKSMFSKDVFLHQIIIMERTLVRTCVPRYGTHDIILYKAFMYIGSEIE